MKRTVQSFLLVFTLLFCSQGFSQVEVDLGYTMGIPQGDFASNTNLSHSMVGQALYQIPKSPLSVGLELGMGNYGRQNENQLYFLITIHR